MHIQHLQLLMQSLLFTAANITDNMMAEEVIEVIRQKVGEIRRVLNLRDVKGSELHQ